MKKTTNPITLTHIRFCTYEASDKIASTKPGIELFDNRCDFLINANLSGLAVLIMLANERRLSTTVARGIRRHVNVVLMDETANCILDSKTIWVNMHSFVLADQYRVDFSLDYASINVDHSYKVVVRDARSHKILGDETVHFFENYQCGKLVTDWFYVKSGAVTNTYGVQYKSIECVDNTYYKVRFDLQPSVEDMPMVLPEFEIRIYSPDNKVMSRFCRPVKDEGEHNGFYLEAPFLTDYYNRGVYYSEILCMDYPVAGMVFATDHDTHEGNWDGEDMDYLNEYSLDAATERFLSAMGIKEVLDMESKVDKDKFDRALQDFIDSRSEEKKPRTDESENSEEVHTEQSESKVYEDDKQSILMSLNRLTGLSSVKKKLSIYEKFVQFNKLRLDHNLPSGTLPLHAMFLGSPGTGKTTVAKRMGVMLRRAGILSKGHVVVKERANLLGPNYSMEETNTLNAIEEAQGGILLIDEAYQLYQPNDPRDPGKFVIETLMTSLADESKRDWMLILAGYPEEMKLMREMNPGLKSRIPDSNIYLFEDFTEHELMDIAEKYLERNNYTLSTEAYEALRKRLANDYSERDKNFGNARHVINLIQTEILPAMAVRVVSENNISTDTLSVIQPTDIPNPIRLPESKRPYIGYRA